VTGAVGSFRSLLPIPAYLIPSNESNLPFGRLLRPSG